MLEVCIVAFMCATVAFWIPGAFSGNCKWNPSQACVLVRQREEQPHPAGSWAETPPTAAQSDQSNTDSNPFPAFIRYSCPPCQYNDMASLIFTTQEKGIKALFHNDLSKSTLVDGFEPTYDKAVLVLFCAMYFVMAVITYGMAVPSGLFVPCILVGASFGRMVRGRSWHRS